VVVGMRLNEQRDYTGAFVREFAKVTLFGWRTRPVVETSICVEGETRKSWTWDGRRRWWEGQIRVTMVDSHKKLARRRGHEVRGVTR
jgi:hypothetical protein